MARKILVLIAVLLAATFVFPLGPAAAKDDKLVVVGWGGAWEKAWRKAYAESFEKETGVKIIWTAPLDFINGKTFGLRRRSRPQYPSCEGHAVQRML